MATSVSSHQPSASTPAQQASLRDYLNSRLAPFIKRAITQSLRDEPEYPLRYVGEYLIQQSLQHEKDAQKPEISQHFQYTLDSRPPQPSSEPPQHQSGSEQQDQNQQQAAMGIQSEALAGGVDSDMGEVERQQPQSEANGDNNTEHASSVNGAVAHDGGGMSLLAEQSHMPAQEDADMADTS